MKSDSGAPVLKLSAVEVTGIKKIGLGERCCIDLISRFTEGLNLTKGNGLVVGSSNKGLFLIHAENIETSFGIKQRPFRVNAGPVSMYVLVPPRDEEGRYQTKYLWELETGDKVLAVDYLGNVRDAIVGRNKIESRPLTMITAVHPTLKNPYKGDSLDFIHTFVQTAETTHLVTKNGDPLPLTELKVGDKILAHAENPHHDARHFGMAVTGIKIIEK